MDSVLETPRLALREMRPADLDFIAAMLAHPEVMRYYPRCYTRAEAEGWVQRQLERYAEWGHGLWLAVDSATGDPRGQAGVVMHEVDGVTEAGLGYLVHHPFWRRGYATEAALGCMRYARDVLGKSRVVTLIRPENVPSQGVARKLGMAPEKLTVFKGYEHLVFAMPSSGEPVG